MSNIVDLYKKIASVPDFSGIEVTTPNTKGLFNNYPLHVAAVWDDTEAISLLIHHGAVIDQKGEHGYTPLMEAVEQGNVKAAKQLLELGAKSSINEFGQSLMDMAEISESKTMLSLLRKFSL